MRLKKVVIQAFGPFKDKVEIDFEKNNITKGLLLITGDTGAGKTSIFDAICFALYGEASSNIRKVNSLRSDFASPALDTYVELSFEHNNKNYIVKRSPEYERKSKRGEGTTKQVASAEFEINGRIETKTNVVTKEIEQLLGLDYKQFHQVAMLSQGEFTKFLLANSDEKTSIFRKIFNTDIYNLIMHKLKENLSVKEQSFSIIKSNIEIEKEKLNYETYSSLTIEEIINKLINKIEIDLKNVNDLKKNRDKLNDEIKQKQSIFDKIAELNNKIIKYNDLNEKLKILIADNEKIGEEKELVKYNRDVATEINLLLKELDQNKNELKDNNEKFKLSKEQKKEVEEIIESKKDSFKNIDNYNNLYDKLNNELIELKNYLETLEKYSKINEKLVETQTKFKINSEKYKKENEQLLLMKESYYADIAYSLASKLEINKPCPVCGSLEHPQIAQSKVSICSKEELDKQEKNVRELENNQKSCEIMIEEYRKNIEDLNLKCDFEYTYEIDKTNELIDKTKKQITDIKEENRKLVSEKERLTTTKTKLATELENLENNVNKYTKNIKNLTEKLNKYLLENKTTLKEYEDKKIEKDELLLLESKIKKYEQNKVEYETMITALKEEVEGKKEEKIDDKKLELENLGKKYQELDYEYVKRSNELTKIKEIKENIEKYYKEYQQALEEYSMIKMLSDTANGKLVGKQKITFENYVQSYYLTNVLVEANKRLYKMTDSRYELRRKELGNLNEKIGLEFSVFDAYTGKERDVSSLSGGEKFKASLSLALGLSDVISMYAGGIKMDCLFIDEGFGSLDQESLNQALNTLTDLADNDKLIGIISHVSELISRIENKIIVNRDNSGSYINIES